MLDWNKVDYEPEDFGGSTHPLQRIRLEIPSGHQLAALTFVIRSEDGKCARGGDRAEGRRGGWGGARGGGGKGDTAEASCVGRRILGQPAHSRSSSRCIHPRREACRCASHRAGSL